MVAGRLFQVSAGLGPGRVDAVWYRLPVVLLGVGDEQPQLRRHRRRRQCTDREPDERLVHRVADCSQPWIVVAVPKLVFAGFDRA